MRKLYTRAGLIGLQMNFINPHHHSNDGGVHVDLCLTRCLRSVTGCRSGSLPLVWTDSSPWGRYCCYEDSGTRVAACFHRCFHKDLVHSHSLSWGWAHFPRFHAVCCRMAVMMREPGGTRMWGQVWRWWRRRYAWAPCIHER